MKMITKKEVKELSNIDKEFCVSIYLPTHEKGHETLDGEDSINLKTELKEVKSKLEDKGMKSDKVETFVQPIQDLIEDGDFWRHQSKGLALFLSEGLFKMYKIPMSVDKFNYVSNELYLKPLMPIFNGNGLFYVLALKKDNVALYEATKYSIVELKLPEDVPSRLEDRVGYDHEQKSLQHRSGQQGDEGSAMYHGHGEGSAEEQNELKRYFRAVDKGLHDIIHENQTPPLLLCCQDEQFALYKEVSNCENLYEKNISMNPEDLNKEELHEKAWNIIETYFIENREEKMKDFKQYHGTGKATSDLREIMKSAVQGKVDSLFIKEGEDLYGKYDLSKMEIEVEEERNPDNASLMNVLANKVFELGGDVYITEKEETPDESSKMNALLRF